MNDDTGIVLIVKRIEVFCVVGDSTPYCLCILYTTFKIWLLLHVVYTCSPISTVLCKSLGCCMSDHLTVCPSFLFICLCFVWNQCLVKVKLLGRGERETIGLQTPNGVNVL
jgi:hypothetical protein